MKIFITRKIPNAGIKKLKNAGYTVDVFEEDRSITNDEILSRGASADALLTLLTDKITPEIIDSLPNLKIISNYAVGFNNIDVAHAKHKNVVVTNTPDILTYATAELAVSLVLACARKVIPAERYTREGKFDGWKPELFLGMELFGKTVGIVGAGRIGFHTARILKAFGTEILYFSRNPKSYFEKKLSATKVSLEDLVAKSDIISLHVPLNDSTFHLLNREILAKVKQGAIIVNTARGEVIDEIALIEKLNSGEISAAGLDVFENEPDIRPELFTAPNVVMLPHIGSATTEARSNMAELCADNIIAVLSGKSPLTPV
ncbi:MAG: D-glycerate dehydrogenase [Melioribacteraceae bacterium]|nr:MAG: D-glycerate dehydrogenase [Melioribacteraceae bacterium]